jgi:acetolactate synthase-1/2/3 large subunit
MHGTYEANMAMHRADLMLCVGARFDDRVTGRLDAFSPNSPEDPYRHRPSRRSTRSSASTSPSSAMSATRSDDHRRCGKHRPRSPKADLTDWWARIDLARAQEPGLSRKRATRSCRNTRSSADCSTATRGHDTYHHHRSRPASDVGRAAFPFRGAQPLDDVGRSGHDGLWPAGRGRRADRASRTALVIDIAGDASVQMNIQEMGTASQYACRSRSSSSTTNIWAWCASGRSCCMKAAIPTAIPTACPISSSWPRPMAGPACARQAGDLDDGDQEDDRGEAGPVLSTAASRRWRTASR